MLEFWNIGIMKKRVLASGSQSLRLGKANGAVALEKQNEYNCIDFPVTVAYFPEQKQKMAV
jgi:hypothetical protein